MTEAYPVRPSDETIIVTPTDMIATYGRTRDPNTADQIEYVGIYLTDARIGEVFIPLGFPAAAQLVSSVTGVLGNRDELRHRFDTDNQ